MSSDWEDFCESKGLNAGCPDDYDKFINSLGEKTEEKSNNIKVPNSNSTSKFDEDEIIELILNNSFIEAVNLTIETHNPSPWGGYIDINDLVNVLDAGGSGVYLCVNFDNNFSLSSIEEKSRIHRIPLIHHEGWLAWDMRDNRLRSSINKLNYMKRCFLSNKSDSLLNQRQLKIKKLLHRSSISTDHGKKPLLVHKHHVHDAVNCREVEFFDPCRIEASNINQYCIVYYDSFGKIENICLSELAEIGLPVFTRIGAYRWIDGDLDPFLGNDAQMLAGAFLIAKINPNSFSWYLVRERGTIFQSAIEQIFPPECTDDSVTVELNYDYRKKSFLSGFDPEAALRNAIYINEWSNSLGSVLITSGGHPLDAECVTTPFLYLHAIKTIISKGYEINYSLSGVVSFSKYDHADEIPF